MRNPNEERNAMNTLTTREKQPVREPSPEREFLTPDVNILETKDDYVLEAEMPGVTRDGLDITLENNVLTFVGRRTESAPKAAALYRESRDADYRRSFELDPVIETDKISARMDDGILTLRLPKAAQSKPRRIAVAD